MTTDQTDITAALRERIQNMRIPINVTGIPLSIFGILYSFGALTVHAGRVTTALFAIILLLLGSTPLGRYAIPGPKVKAFAKAIPLFAVYALVVYFALIHSVLVVVNA